MSCINVASGKMQITVNPKHYGYITAQRATVMLKVDLLAECYTSDPKTMRNIVVYGRLQP